MLTLECQNKMFSMISQGLMSHFSFRQLFQFIREHTRKQQVRISITLRVNARRCRLPEYLIAFKHRCVRSNCSCLTNIVSVRHKGGRVFRVTSASIFNDFECQKCKFVELPQAPFQKPFESCKNAHLDAVYCVPSDRNCFEMLIFVRKENNSDSHLKIVLGVLFIIIFMSLKAWMLHKFASDAVARNQDFLLP